MRFKNVILMGSGKIACDCLRHLMTIVPTKDIIVLETQYNSLSMLARVSEKEEIQYYMMEKKKDIECFLIKSIDKVKSLIISANNRFIYTPQIIQSENVEIINFHYALLPHYRGMNIPTWVIFNNEKETGVTWHYVTEQIDHGKILAQRIIQIDSTTTAFEITKKGMLLGIEAFRSFISQLLEKPIEGEEVIYPEDEKIYYNSQLPMNGILDLQQPVDDILRLLRSYDYGGLDVIPFLRVNYENEQYIVKGYEMFDRKNTKTLLRENLHCVVVGNGQIVLHLYKSNK